MLACSRCGLQTQKVVKIECGHYFCQKCIDNAKTTHDPLCSLDIQQERKPCVEQDENSFPDVKHINDHVTDDVKSGKASEQCYYCDALVEQDNLEYHYEVCHAFPVKCPRSCGKETLRYEAKEHAIVCQNNLQLCQFSPLGCNFMGTQLEIENHEQDCFFHLKLLMELVTKQKHSCEQFDSTKQMKNERSLIMRSKDTATLSLNEQVNDLRESLLFTKCTVTNIQQNLIPPTTDKSKSEWKEQTVLFLGAENEKLCDKIIEMNTSILELKTTINSMEDTQSSFKRELQLQKELNSALQKKSEETLLLRQEMQDLKASFADLKKKLDSISQPQNRCEDESDMSIDKSVVLRHRSNTDQPQRLSCRIVSTHSKDYVWEIENFSRLHQDAKSGIVKYLYSDPFCSNYFGNSLRIKMAPNGVDSGSGTHLSLALVFLQSQINEIFEWPLIYEVKFTLLDQISGKQNFSKNITVKFEHAHRPFFTTEWEAEFVSHEKLKSPYLVKDKLKVILDVTMDAGSSQA